MRIQIKYSNYHFSTGGWECCSVVFRPRKCHMHAYVWRILPDLLVFLYVSVSVCSRFSTNFALADLRGPRRPWHPLALKNIRSELKFFMRNQYIFEKIFSLTLLGIFFIHKLKTDCKKQSRSTALFNIIFYKYTTINSDEIDHILGQIHYFNRNSSTMQNVFFKNEKLEVCHGSSQQEVDLFTYIFPLCKDVISC